MKTSDEIDGSSGIKAIRLSCVLCAWTLATISTGYAQIDPEPRSLLQLGVNQSLHNDGPTAAYAFYYLNMPEVPTTNTTLRWPSLPFTPTLNLVSKGCLDRTPT